MITPFKCQKCGSKRFYIDGIVSQISDHVIAYTKLKIVCVKCAKTVIVEVQPKSVQPYLRFRPKMPKERFE